MWALFEGRLLERDRSVIPAHVAGRAVHFEIVSSTNYLLRFVLLVSQLIASIDSFQHFCCRVLSRWLMLCAAVSGRRSLVA